MPFHKIVLNENKDLYWGVALEIYRISSSTYLPSSFEIGSGALSVFQFLTVFLYRKGAHGTPLDNTDVIQLGNILPGYILFTIQPLNVVRLFQPWEYPTFPHSSRDE